MSNYHQTVSNSPFSSRKKRIQEAAMFCSLKRFLMGILVVGGLLHPAMSQGWQSKGNSGHNKLKRGSMFSSSKGRGDYSLMPKPFGSTRGGHTRMTTSKRARNNRHSSHGAASLSLPFPFDNHNKNHRIYTATHSGVLVRPRQSVYIPQPASNPVFVPLAPAVRTATDENRVGKAVAAAYFCIALAMSIPSVVLVPTIASQRPNSAAFCAAVASMGTLGGGIGKLLNGLVCQMLGGKSSMTLYMAALSIVSLCLPWCCGGSTAFLGAMLASMEFLWSIQWTAACVLLANHYQHDAQKFASAITTLSLSSTAGIMVAKLGGTALLSVLPWQVVARIGALIAMVGAAISHHMVRDGKQTTTPSTSRNLFSQNQNTPDINPSNWMDKVRSVLQSFQRVLTNPIFWVVGLAHSASFVARTCDRILGSFYAHVAQGLPASLCVGSTSSCTIGFVHGLAQGRVFMQLHDKNAKLKHFRQKFFTAIVASAGLALIPSMSWLSPSLRAVGVALLSGIMASSLSFQLYQIPNMFGIHKFPNERAIFLSLMDCFGYFCSTAVWSATGRMVGEGQGWPSAWVLLSIIYAAGGAIMWNNLKQHILL